MYMYVFMYVGLCKYVGIYVYICVYVGRQVDR